MNCACSKACMCLSINRAPQKILPRHWSFVVSLLLVRCSWRTVGQSAAERSCRDTCALVKPSAAQGEPMKKLAPKACQ